MHIDRNVDSGAVELIEVVHGLRLAISSDDDFDVLGEIFRQPESDISFFVGSSINEVVDALKDKDNFAEDLIDIFDDLSFDFLITHIEPVGKVVPELFFMQLNLLSDIEFFSELDKDSIDGIVVVGVVSAGGGEMQNDKVIFSS